MIAIGWDFIIFPRFLLKDNVGRREITISIILLVIIIIIVIAHFIAHVITCLVIVC